LTAQGRITHPRVTTGISGLDRVLGGGIPRGSSVFVTGLPGAGKTVLSEQALFANALRSESVLYVTTLSEPPVKMLHFSRGFQFFHPELLERTVRYADLGDALREGGAAGALRHLEELVRTHRPEFLVLDSFKVFREHLAEASQYRAFAAELMIVLATWEITSFLVGEYAFEEIATQPEFAIADGILHLSGTEESRRQKRYLNVVKMRGADAFLGRHSYEIDNTGLTLYPRMLPTIQAEYVLSEDRIGSCVRGLSEMLGGGIPVGSVMLISGGTGTGKTLTALSFAVATASASAPALYVTFEEAPNQLIRNASRLGWDVEGLVEKGALQFMHVSPSELDLDRHAFELSERSDEIKAQLVVIDSISALDLRGDDGDVSSAETLWALTDYFKRKGVTLILTTEAYSFFESAIAERRNSYLSDSILLLRLVEERNDVRRMVNVLKMRWSQHDTALRELCFTASGMEVAPPSLIRNLP
jgi:circadian clock protein KaiC